MCRTWFEYTLKKILKGGPYLRGTSHSDQSKQSKRASKHAKMETPVISAEFTFADFVEYYKAKKLSDDWEGIPMVVHHEFEAYIDLYKLENRGQEQERGFAEFCEHMEWHVRQDWEDDLWNDLTDEWFVVLYEEFIAGLVDQLKETDERCKKLAELYEEMKGFFCGTLNPDSTKQESKST